MPCAKRKCNVEIKALAVPSVNLNIQRKFPPNEEKKNESSKKQRTNHSTTQLHTTRQKKNHTESTFVCFL